MSDTPTTITSVGGLDAPTGAAVASGARPSQASALSAPLAVAWRSLLKIKHVPEQLGDVIGIPILFTPMFTYLFGGALAGSARIPKGPPPAWKPMISPSPITRLEANR